MAKRNAGAPLGVRMFPITYFQQAAADLQTLHQHGIYLRDIKPGNMAYDEQRRQINFIDVDDRINQSQTGKIKGLCTTRFITYELLIELYGHPGRRNFAAFRTADEYAFLLSLLLHTHTDDYEVDNAIIKAITDPEISKYHQSWEVSLCHIGVLTKANREHFKTWINLYIKPEYRADAMKLLSNPARFSREYPDHRPLAEMLDYNFIPQTLLP